MSKIEFNDLEKLKEQNFEELSVEEIQKILNDMQEQLRYFCDFMNKVNYNIKDEEHEIKTDIAFNLSNFSDNEIINIENIAILDSDIISDIHEKTMTLNIITPSIESKSFEKLKNFLELYEKTKLEGNNPIITLTVFQKGNRMKFATLTLPIYYCKNTIKAYQKENAFKFLFSLENCAIMEL